MIYDGDIVRLFNPSEKGLKRQPHMHIIKNVLNEAAECSRSFAVCTSSPTRFIKEEIPFFPVTGAPFKKMTYIRLDPIFIVKNVKIKISSRTNPIFRLGINTETSFFEKVKGAKEEELDREEFLELNPTYTERIWYEISPHWNVGFYFLKNQYRHRWYWFIKKGD